MGWLAKYRNELSLLLAICTVVGITLIFNRQYINEPEVCLPDILKQTSLLGIFALGTAIVIIAGGIDLSSGAVIAFCGSICALVMTACAPLVNGDRNLNAIGPSAVALAIVVTLFVGLMVGTLHAWMIIVIRLPPFVATLASLVGLRSLAKVLNPAVTKFLYRSESDVAGIVDRGRTTLQAESDAFKALSEWHVVLGLFLVLSLAAYVLMNRTVWGRHIYAMGGNEDAARLSGIRTDRLKWLAYSIGSVTAALAGILYVSKTGTANPATLGAGYELIAIAAAVVGGCSLRGGVGLIPGVMLGVLFLQLINDSVNKVIGDNPDDYLGMIVGLLVVVAVTLNELNRGGGIRRHAFFPGALGAAVIPILGLLVGVVIYINTSFTTGAITFLSITVLLAACKVFQTRAAT